VGEGQDLRKRRVDVNKRSIFALKRDRGGKPWRNKGKKMQGNGIPTREKDEPRPPTNTNPPRKKSGGRRED